MKCGPQSEGLVSVDSGAVNISLRIHIPLMSVLPAGPGYVEVALARGIKQMLIEASPYLIEKKIDALRATIGLVQPQLSKSNLQEIQRNLGYLQTNLEEIIKKTNTLK